MGAGDEFHTLVSGIDYPMFVVTTATALERSGCLVGFLTQASIDPPRLVVMLSKTNRTSEVAATAEHLVVHFLHTGNRGLSGLFGEQTGDEVDKFERCTWERVEGLDPPVIQGTRGWVAGRILLRMDAGDHIAHLIDLLDARVDSPDNTAQLGFQSVRNLEPGHPA